MFIQKRTFIQKLYIHPITLHSYIDMAGQSRDCMISTYKNKRNAVHMSCRQKNLKQYQQKFLIRLETCYNRLFESK